jgi:hypothetical protein
MSSSSFPPPPPTDHVQEPDLAAAVAAAVASLAASDAFVTSQFAAMEQPEPTPEPAPAAAPVVAAPVVAAPADGPRLPSLPPKASPPPRANPLGPISTIVPITPFSLVPAAPPAPSPASAGRGRSKGGRKLFALVALLVVVAGIGAAVQLVRRAHQDHVSAAPAGSSANGNGNANGNGSTNDSTTVATPAPAGVTIEEAGFRFDLPKAPRRSTVDLSASMPGATDIKWALLDGPVLTTVQLVQMPAEATADGGNTYARAVVAAIMKRPHAQVNVTSRPEVSGATARYYEIGLGAHVLYVYTVVKGATVVTVLSSGGDGTAAPAAFTMARNSLQFGGQSLAG